MSTASSMALVADGLGIAVGSRWLVRGLDAAFAPGTITAVVGPNGAGKSTLLRCLCGLRAPEEGRATLGDIAVETWSPRERAKAIAYLPQATPIVHDMRVADVVALGRAPYRGRLLGEGDGGSGAIAAALERVEAAGLASRFISTLSGGERQRVMLARMLATGARWLVMDEPTAALDIGHALSLHALCRQLASDGRGIVVAMHDLDAARGLADDALCLDRRDDDGRHHHGPAREVLSTAVLQDVFGVAVHEHAGHLHFDRRPVGAREATPEPSADAD